MVAIPFPVTTNPGQKPQEGDGRLINVYAEQKGQAVVWHRAPGLTVLGDDEDAGTWTHWSFPYEEFFSVRETPIGDGQFLGGVLVNTAVYARFGTKFYTIDSGGALTLLTGTAGGLDKTHWARNNAATPDIVFVCDDGPFAMVAGTKTAYSSLSGASGIGSPNSVCFHDSYFMFGYGDGTIQASGINATTINALDFTTAESNPDGLTRLWSHKGLLYAAGPSTIEVYGTPINATGFPLTRQGYNITPGLITPFAVAGFEPEFGNFPLYVGSDNTVRWLKAFSPEKVSPPDLDFLLASVEDKDDIEALCYISRGNAFWQVSGPTFTWVYNLNNGTWHERQSYGIDRSRMSLSLFAFDKWLTGDTEGAHILEVKPDELLEVDLALVATIESALVKEFPNRVRCARADFDFTVGVGILGGQEPIESDPTVQISWSDDGGVNYENPRNKELGQQADSEIRVSVYLTGLTGPQGRRWKVSVSDPVHFGLLGGDMVAELRNR